MRIAWGITFLFLAGTVYAQDVRVVEVKGSAEMRSAIDQAWAPLKAGDEIPEGAWIQTAFKSLVYIKFWTNTVVQIKSVTLVQVKGLSNDGKRMAGRLHLALGAARIRVKPDREEIVDFKVVTTRMTTSIKGTEVFFLITPYLLMGVVEGETASSSRSKNVSPQTVGVGGQVEGAMTMANKPVDKSTGASQGGKFKVTSESKYAATACIIRCARMASEWLAESEAGEDYQSGDGGDSDSSGTWTDNTPPIP